jgi:hypothetical protein
MLYTGAYWLLWSLRSLMPKPALPARIQRDRAFLAPPAARRPSQTTALRNYAGWKAQPLAA